MFISDVGDNLILLTDSYKFSHWKQLPPGTRYAKAYLEARGGLYPNVLTFAGLQMSLYKLFGRPITRYMIDEAESYVTPHMGPGIFNRAGWLHILNKHGGWLPLRVRAVPEGHLVPIHNAVMTVESTDEQVPWLANYFETAIYPWYGYTVATQSFHARQIVKRYLEQTGTPEAIDFKVHDFGFRATTDPFVGWQAAVGGLAHMVNFQGTDTTAALVAARKYYGCNMAGFSIPAAEHFTITSWMEEPNRQVGETQAYDNMLSQFPTGLVAVVSDSDNIYFACDHLWGEMLKDKVLARDGVLVIRPDSGNPPEVVIRCLEILGKRFGFSVHQKGYKVLNPKVRLIWGDGIDNAGIEQILSVMQLNGWSADNIAFGMGGALLQKVDRDKMKWAFKCCVIERDSRTVEVYKNPITDKGKSSKSGDIHLFTNGTDYVTATTPPDPGWTDAMVTFYENTGDFMRPNETLDTIRERRAAAEARLS
jgi:nicotinamide phosphoribosyltransferase